jgi:hypothetical protein
MLKNEGTYFDNVVDPDPHWIRIQVNPDPLIFTTVTGICFKAMNINRKKEKFQNKVTLMLKGTRTGFF